MPLTHASRTSVAPRSYFWKNSTVSCQVEREVAQALQFAGRGRGSVLKGSCEPRLSASWLPAHGSAECWLPVLPSLRPLTGSDCLHRGITLKGERLRRTPRSTVPNFCCEVGRVGYNEGQEKEGRALSTMLLRHTCNTYRHAHSYTHIHVHRDTHACMHTCTCTQKHMRGRTHMGIMHSCTYVYKYTPVWVHMHTRHAHTCMRVHNAHPFAAARLRPLANQEALWAHTWDDAKVDWVAHSPSICICVPPPSIPWEQRGRGQDGGR